MAPSPFKGWFIVIVTLEEMKKYLRVFFDDEDALIESLIGAAERMCMDILRADNLDGFREIPCVKIAVMYAVAYLFEHREEADHHALALTLRSLLFGIRGEGF